MAGIIIGCIVGGIIIGVILFLVYRRRNSSGISSQKKTAAITNYNPFQNGSDKDPLGVDAEL